MKKIIITLFLVAFSVFYIKAQDTQAITNGFPIEIQNVPYQVSIQDSDGSHCGGSIINNRYVLKAVHFYTKIYTNKILTKRNTNYEKLNFNF